MRKIALFTTIIIFLLIKAKSLNAQCKTIEWYSPVSLNANTVFTRLPIGSNDTLVKSGWKLGYQFGINGQKRIRKYFYLIYGVSFGKQSYSIVISDDGQGVKNTIGVYNLNIPFYFERLYSFTLKWDFRISLGLNANMLISSLESVGSSNSSGDNVQASVDVKPIPQPGIFYALGFSRRLRANNSIGFHFYSTVNFINSVVVDYHVLSALGDELGGGKIKSKGTYWGIKVIYKFRNTRW